MATTYSLFIDTFCTEPLMLFLSEGLVPWVAALFLSSEILEQMSPNAMMMDQGDDANDSCSRGSAQSEVAEEDQNLDDVAEMVEYDEEDEVDFTDVIDTTKVRPRHPSPVTRRPSLTCLTWTRLHPPSSTPRALGWGGARSGRATPSPRRHML